MKLALLPIDAIPALDAGTSCNILTLPGSDTVRVWVLDMAPGSRWPVVDNNEHGESVYVVAGCVRVSRCL